MWGGDGKMDLLGTHRQEPICYALDRKQLRAAATPVTQSHQRWTLIHPLPHPPIHPHRPDY